MRTVIFEGTKIKLSMVIVITLFVLFHLSVFAKDPDCTGWPTNMAFGSLKNAGITDNDKLDFTKTKTIRLASEKIGKDIYYGKDLYRQVHHITFTEKSGNTIEVITVNEASSVECSMSDVDVYVVKQNLEAPHYPAIEIE